MQKETKEKIKKLVQRYESLSENEKQRYNEQQTKQHFIQPLFGALGWNFEHEVWPETDVSGKRVDYSFKIKDHTKFFLEAKAIPVNLDEERWAEQAIDYSWHKSVPWVILSDFEAIKVFNTEWEEPNVQNCQFIEISYKEYLTSEKLWWLSREAFEKGILDKQAEEVGKRPRRTIDEQLAEDLILWRNLLFNDLRQFNPKVEPRKILENVQKILDRLIFLRTLEDRKIEDIILQPLAREWKEKGKANELLAKLNKIFRKIDKDYNSGLFEEGACDHLGEKLDADDNTFVEIINELYRTKSKGIRYNFADIPADIFGSIYEQYLGHIQKEETKEKKSTKRKSQGIYYTPRYIVDYIIKNTLGEVLKSKKSEEIKNLKILDPACGSGSFLICAYQSLIDYWQKQEKHKFKGRGDKLEAMEKAFKKRNGNLISSEEKMRILRNNIYGVDLDDEAAELARLNLLLKMVNRRAKLPNLDNNIQIGNSLISGSEKELKEYFGENWRAKKPFNWEQKFSEVFKQGGFDVIIGNPPYVRVDSLDDEEKKYWKNIFSASQGKYDLYYLFIEEAIKLLKTGGYLGFIVPNKFCVATSAKKLRELIKHSSEQCIFVSVSKLAVFADASNYPVILLLKKGKDTKEIKVKSFNSVVDFLKNNYESYSLGMENMIILPSGIIPININQSQLELALKLIKNSKKLSNFLKVSEGLRIPPKFETKTKEKFGIVKQYQFERYSPIKSGTFISESNINKFVDKNSTRFINSLKEKIIISEDALNIVSTIDVDFYIPQGGVYFGVLSDEKLHLKYVMSLLNSHLLSFLYKVLFGGMHMGGGYLRYRTEFLEQLPLIEETPMKQKEFIKLADKILEFNKDLQKLDPILDKEKYEEIKEEIEKTDREIDQKVYSLYGLTREEIKIAEGEQKFKNLERPR